jgi:hypothetical protein
MVLLRKPVRDADPLKMPVAVQIYDCRCRVLIDRDINTAINIDTAQINACGDKEFLAQSIMISQLIEDNSEI